MLRLVQLNDDKFHHALRAFLLSREASGCAESTIEFYDYTLARFADFAPGWPPAPGTCQAWVLSMRRDGLSEASIHTYYGGLSVFFNWCVKRNYLDHNPLEHISRPRIPRSIPRAIPKQTLNRLFTAMERASEAGNMLALRDHAMFRLIYDCGLRATEAACLEVVDLDMGEHSAMVRGKRDDQRVVYFGHRTRQALHLWLAVLHPGCPWLFVSVHLAKGFRHLTRSGVNQALHRWCDRAGIEGFRVHDLRHSYARHALRAGIDVEMVSRQLGHHDPAFTLRIYARSEDRDRREVHLKLSPGDHLD